ncbi:MAG: hypothetical protein K1X67_15130 [Fimbriimonadaceae bacterium]|nr:hypothetical protein [Fimbriimonadaceae bacterium]
MNAYFGYAVANSAIVPASANGSIDVFSFNRTNLILDVNGYFAPDDGTGRGLRYYPVPQCRVLDTQSAAIRRNVRWACNHTICGSVGAYTNSGVPRVANHG